MRSVRDQRNRGCPGLQRRDVQVQGNSQGISLKPGCLGSCFGRKGHERLKPMVGEALPQGVCLVVPTEVTQDPGQGFDAPEWEVCRVGDG